jgi:hypothetical protein
MLLQAHQSDVYAKIEETIPKRLRVAKVKLENYLLLLPSANYVDL